MNEEIKEILEFDFESQGERIEINEHERNILLNYITNLQNENEKLKETLQTDKLMKAFMVEHNRNEKAAEKLGKYKHYMTPTEEQNSENEDIVDSAYNILKGGNEK